MRMFNSSGLDKNPQVATKPQVKVSVIIPTLNEAKNLPLILPHLPHDQIHEVILVDGRSTDGTVAVAKSLLPSIKVVLEPRPGKGAAMRAGYQAAEGDILVVLDADGSNDPREIPRFIAPLLEGADFVKGSRFAPMGGTTDMPRIRKWGNKAFVIMVNTLFGGTFTDLCYGYHAFWRYCLDVIDLKNVDGFEIDTALYLRALRRKLRIIDVPSFEGYRFFGVGKLQTIPDGWRVLKTILSEWVESLKPQPDPVFVGFRNGNREVDHAEQAAYQQELAEESLAREESALAGDSVYAALPNPYPGGMSNLNPRSGMEYLLQFILVNMRAASGSVVVLDGDGQAAYGCAMYENALIPLEARDLPDTLDRGLAGWVMRNRQAVVISSTQRDPRWMKRGWEDREAVVRSALGVPLMEDGRVVGVITLARPGADQFTEEDLTLVEDMTMAGRKALQLQEGNV